MTNSQTAWIVSAILVVGLAICLVLALLVRPTDRSTPAGTYRSVTGDWCASRGGSFEPNQPDIGIGICEVPGT